MDLIDIQRRPVAEVVGELKADSLGNSTEAGRKLVRLAAESGLNMQDYLKLAVDTRANAEDAAKYSGLNGFEATLAFLNLPFKNSLEEGIVLQAASETFQKFPGTRAMFPEVMDQILRWTNRQDQIVKIDALVSQSRTIAGTELISTFVTDDSGERDSFTVPEMARIPVRTIRTTQQTVGMFKHGSAYRTSYEFNRRASLDLLTPYAARIARELELSKVKAATAVLINGDGVNSAAPTEALGAYGADFTGGKSLKDNYKALAKFLLTRASKGIPVDTLAGNFDMFCELLFMFTPTLQNKSQEEALAAAGAPAVHLTLPILNGSVNFALAPAVPAGKLLAFTKGETLEELREAGGDVAENERSILTQTITYVRTEVTGYKLTFGDTRTLLDCTA